MLVVWKSLSDMLLVCLDALEFGLLVVWKSLSDLSLVLVCLDVLEFGLLVVWKSPSEFSDFSLQGFYYLRSVEGVLLGRVSFGWVEPPPPPPFPPDFLILY